MPPRLKSPSFQTFKTRHPCLCHSLLEHAPQQQCTMPSFLHVANNASALPPTVSSLSAAGIVSSARALSLIRYSDSIPRTATATKRTDLMLKEVACINRDKTPNKPPLPLPSTNGDKELSAVRKKTSSPFPPTLRQALGRSRVDTSCRKIKKHIASLASYNEPPSSYFRKGTPGKPKPAQTLRQPKKPSLKRQEALELGPKEVCELFIRAFMPCVPAEVEPLSLELVKEVEKLSLLKGYCARAIASGCIEFAANALQTTTAFSEKKQKQEGVETNALATRCAYNALRWERRRFAKVLEERKLSPDEERDILEEIKRWKLGRCGGRKRRSWRGMNSSARVERPSRLRWVEQAPKEFYSSVAARRWWCITSAGWPLFRWSIDVEVLSRSLLRC